MAEHPEPFSINVGSKLLFGAIMLMGLGIIAAVLLPVMTAFGPAAGLEQIIGAVMPGVMLLVAGVVLGVIAGIFLGYAHGKYPAAR